MTKFKAYMLMAAFTAATPTLAGEITGTGEPTPVKSGAASSICSFSGLNDDTSGPSDLVQSYGQIVAAFGQPYPGVPGTACRGNL